MGEWEHGGGFSLDASVRIEADDREGLERLLRYCARPAFALERLRQIDPEHLVYESVKPAPGGSVSLMLTSHELLDRLAAWQNKPSWETRSASMSALRTHNKRAPNSALT